MEIVYASRCRRPRFESHLMEKPSKKSANLRVHERSQFFGLSVYLQEEPVLCLRKRSQKHVINRGPLSPIFFIEVSSSGEAGTLPAEPVPDASKMQGATIAILYFAFLLFFGRVSAQLAPEKCFKIILQRLANLSKNEEQSQTIRPKCSQNPPWEALPPNSGSLVLFQILQKTHLLT